MPDEEHREHSAEPTGERNGGTATLAVNGDEYVTRHIEAALSPLRAFLTREQIEIVRGVLRSTIETDPVSRLLAQNALRAYTQSVKLA